MKAYSFNTSITPGPAVESRKGEGRMSDEELQRIMVALVKDAESMVDGELSPERAKATAYYRGEPFGNEEPGRSQVVLTEVRDVIHAVLPSLLRIFFGPERVVEFTARTKEGIALAEQASDYIQYVFAEDNHGFMQTYEVLKDGLVRKLGIIKWWWEPEQTRAESDTLSEDDLTELAARDDVELTKITVSKIEGMFEVEYTVTTEGRPRTCPVPPEEWLFDRAARNIEDALFVGHRTKKRRGDLIAMGYDPKEIDEHSGDSNQLDMNVERLEREATQSAVLRNEPEAGDANREIDYIEGYPKIDVDGDGIPELRKVCMIGTSHYVIHDEPADERPFAAFCPIPEPHVLVGQSEADLVMDLQLLKSNVARSMLDSLALSIFPRMAFQENFVSVEDLLSTEIGAPIRTRKENAVQPIAHPFTGEAAMPILEWVDGISESRVGREKGAMGLDVDSLQSSTQEGVTAALAASQEQIELMARIAAEQFFKPLFRGLYRMMVKYRPKERIARLRGGYVAINTAVWEADIDCSVNVGIGTSLPAKRVAALESIAAKQKDLIDQYGPGPENPITSMAQLRNTLARIAMLTLGTRDASEFYKPVDPNWAPPPAPPQMSPEQALAQAQVQVEQMRTQKELEIKQAELTLKQDQQEWDQEFEVRRLSVETVLKRYQIDSQFKSSHTQMLTELDAAAEEKALEGAMDVARMRHEMEMERRRHALEAEGQAHDQAMAERQTAAQEAAATAAPPSEGE